MREAAEEVKESAVLDFEVGCEEDAAAHRESWESRRTEDAERVA